MTSRLDSKQKNNSDSTYFLFWKDNDNKQPIVFELLRLAFAIISLSEQHKTPLLSLHFEVGVTVFLYGVCNHICLNIPLNHIVITDGFPHYYL